MPKQELEFADYLSPLAVGAVFTASLLIICVFFLNWCFIRKEDDITVFERWGHKHDVKLRLGVHRPSVVARIAASKRPIIIE
ncbi:unnamed protein product [Auanema sp. JU1783]|nr:unnamed protein product [Auanema sp. JU1783]